MKARELVDLFRDDVTDTLQPYLWSEQEVYEYLNDAYFMMVRQMGGIIDATSSVTQIPIVATEQDAQIDRRILRIRQATLASNNRDIRIINAQDVGHLVDEDYGVLRRINNIDTPGEVRYMITGLEEGLVRWVKVPEVDDTAQLLVERLPLERIEQGSDEFTGLGEEHHYHLLKWVRHLAFRKPDVETFNGERANEEKEAFLDYCRLANEEKNRRRHKVRVVRYGGY